MKKIALYGGAYDPFTKSHMRVANALLNCVNEVWIMPCYKSYYGKKMESPNHRANMINLAIKENNNDNIKLCDYEIKNKLTGQSYDIMKSFLKEHDIMNTTYYFALGLDGANKIEEWTSNYEKDVVINKMLPFVVIARHGYEAIKDAWYLKEPHMYMDMVDDNCSSTLVRQAIKDGKYTDLINKQIYDYIISNKLYLKN